MKINFDHQLNSLAAEIRQLLFAEWDPADINRNDYLIDRYDDYIPTIYRLVVYRKPVEEISAQLNFIEKCHIGIDPRRELNQNIAVKLFAMGIASRKSCVVRQPVLPHSWQGPVRGAA